MNRIMVRIAVGAVAIGITAAPAIAIAATGHSHRGGAAGSRLDDGKALLPQAKITEQQAIASARGAASGSLNEVDLEHYASRLVFNVDVGAKDVKVDASDGKVLSVDQDD